MRLVLAAPFLLFLFGCAPSPKMPISASQHDALAAAEERAASTELTQAQIAVDAFATRCAAPKLTGGSDAGACWTSIARARDEHRAAALEHSRRAAEHRAASRELRDAEARACAGLSAYDRDTSPFAHTEDILRVESLGRGHGTLEGAVVTFRAVPGMSAAWLQRVIDCHLARNEAMGHDVPEMPYCPLVPRGVSATVSQTEDGVTVTIRSSDSEGAIEVYRRAKALVPSGSH
jgi:hypothetical protein